MNTMKLNKDDIIDSLRKMNRELIEENEHLRKQIKALEQLAIETKTDYNSEYLMRAWQEVHDDF